MLSYDAFCDTHDEIPRHGCDEDCEPFLLDGECTVCRVTSDDPCAACDGRRYHRDDCTNVDADTIPADAFAGIRKGYDLIDEFCRIGQNDRVECFRKEPGRIPLWQGMKRHTKKMLVRFWNTSVNDGGIQVRQ